MHDKVGASRLLVLGGLGLVASMVFWWRDVIRESTYEGQHTVSVQVGLSYGFILFIASEIMFFFAFFWAFFHVSLSPAVELGSIWPPPGIQPFNPWHDPFLNTYILLFSGLTVTAAHYYLLAGDRVWSSFYLALTLQLAILFTTIQLSEYFAAPFSINDGVYGSTFFMATGFHGLHVLVGTIFLSVAWLRLLHYQLSRFHHLGFSTAAWYWHFVDVVWLFLFVMVYWWGGAQ